MKFVERSTFPSPKRFSRTRTLLSTVTSVLQDGYTLTSGKSIGREEPITTAAHTGICG